jgi:hypothetical protein
MANWSDYAPHKTRSWYDWSRSAGMRSKKIIVTPINWPTNNPLLKIKEDYKVELMKKDLVIPPQPLSEEERDKYLKEMANENKFKKPEKLTSLPYWPDDWEDWFPGNK